MEFKIATLMMITGNKQIVWQPNDGIGRDPEALCIYKSL